jgi:signal transduction histidine kinase
LLWKRSIRIKFVVGLGLLLLLLATLAGSGLYTTYAYRGLVKSLSWRAEELPLAARLSRQVGQCQITLGKLRGLRARPWPAVESDLAPAQMRMIREQLRTEMYEADQLLSQYQDQLERQVRDGSPIADKASERRTVQRIEEAMRQVHATNQDEAWMLDDVKIGLLESELDELADLTAELPSHLHGMLQGFAREVRNKYRTLIVGTWVVCALAFLIFVVMLRLLYQWVIEPLRELVHGSRRVAGGEFGYRIRMTTSDEMAELAVAMNDMTERFQTIRDDLDRQVQERTRQVVRSEKLASVGFLAAGVAHEINNPLASIAMCAESLESRVRSLLDDGNGEHGVIGRYLSMIQTEAFRCKEITEKLLDFSRIGPVARQATDLVELVRGVIEMIGHLGRYQQMHVEFESEGPAVAPVQPQEMKQVVLNLLCNALDSLDPGGTVRIRLQAKCRFAELTLTDNGCGMPPQVLEHIFEPFYTRRRTGQGTGLGLSITYRIITDHGGEIVAKSDGPGRGSTFRVRLPISEASNQLENEYRAA